MALLAIYYVRYNKIIIERENTAVAASVYLIENITKYKLFEILY